MSFIRSSRGARSLPRKRPYLAAMACGFLALLAVVAALTLVFVLVRHGEPRVLAGLIAAFGVFAAFWFLGLLCRRAARCPLCRGTPLLDGRAAKHRRAVRFRPLNYGASAVAGLILSQRFRCMHCGTAFDLWKPPGSRERPE